jgi:hypothetical protein
VVVVRGLVRYHNLQLENKITFNYNKQSTMKKASLALIAIVSLVSCSENYSNGERVGLITQFSRTGLLFKSWEGHLNMTQTGMNSSTPFDFSIDNNIESERKDVISTIDSAAKLGWKVRLIYHECRGKNMTSSRGDTDHFIDSVQVLDKNISSLFNISKDTSIRSGKVIDTIYVVIDKSKQ